jgi:hypothetical protein
LLAGRFLIDQPARPGVVSTRFVAAAADEAAKLQTLLATD